VPTAQTAHATSLTDPMRPLRPEETGPRLANATAINDQTGGIMDIQAVDPRTQIAGTGTGRGQAPSQAGVFQGVMQMMAEMSANRADSKADSRSTDRTDAPRPDTSDNRVADDEEERVDATASDADDDPVESPRPEQAATDPAGPAPVLELPAPPAVTQVADAPAASQSGAQQAPGLAGQPPETLTPVPQQAAPQPMPLTPVNPTPAKPTPVQAAATAPTASQNLQPTEQLALRGGALAAKAELKPDSRPDAKANALLGAKVTVETSSAPVARSQGVSSAALIQAQQAAANPVTNPAANPTAQAAAANAQAQPAPATSASAQPLHVGANQATFVGADSNGGANGGATNSGNQNASAQHNGAQNGGAQNNGAQAQHLSIGVTFGATIGQRGFGGETARAQFQEILATRTARPAALSSGDATRMPAYGGTPSASASPSSPSSLTAMAGLGGPQSMTTAASTVIRAEAAAHGRPGATMGTPADQVAMKLSTTAKDGGGKVTLRLTPEELGKVDIKMEISKDGLVRAVVAAERPETLELLQRDAKGLEKALQDAGLRTDGESLEFDLRGEGGQHADDASEDSAAHRTAGDGGSTDSKGDDGEAVANDDAPDDGVGADGSLNLVA
jgi:flagellar hook-length control protein FliK